jgi:beta-fructofuranosidase
LLRLPDEWVWDSWVADDGETYHLYFLKAPRALGEPSQRHARATIGHATSTDLVTWTDRGTTLAPSAPGGWDDLAVWTGSTVRADDGSWRMFYTALNTGRGHVLRDQRIGVVESRDLHSWRRVADAPVLVADRRWYTTLEEDPTASETWRDPFVFRDPGGDGWHALVTARLAGAERYDDGVLAHARSEDLVTWEVQPPVSGDPSGFGQLEVPQVRVVDGRPVLVFTCHPEEQSEARKAEHGHWCTWSVVGEPGGSLLGPWDVSRAVPFRAEPTLFAAPLVQRRDGSWVLVGFRNQEPEGIHSFDIIDPVEVAIEGDGLQAR